MRGWRRLVPYMPAVAVLVLILCIWMGLRGYETPVYAVQEPETETAPSTETEREETSAKESETKKKDKKSPVSAKKTSAQSIEISAGVGKGSKTIGEEKEAAAYKDGTYQGSGTGFGGTISVEVVIRDGQISSIRVIASKDDGSYLKKASALLQTIIETQSTNVDTVSGATYSSVGLIEAVRDALRKAAVSGSDSQAQSGDESQAGDKVQDSGGDDADAKDSQKKKASGRVPYLEGIYYGTAEGYLDDITVAVVIQDETIKAILVTESGDDEEFLNRAKTVADNVVKQQNTDVDVVAGATYSSNGILNAIKNALKEAKRATQAAKGEQPAADEKKKDDRKPAESADKGTQKEKEKESTSKEAESSGESTAGGSEESETSGYRDGDYEVSVRCEPDEYWDFDPYDLSLKVTVKDGRITAVMDIAGSGDRHNESYIKRAANGTSSRPGVVAQILEKGQPEDIDTVSMATCSSKSIIEGCKKALEAARTGAQKK